MTFPRTATAALAAALLFAPAFAPSEAQAALVTYNMSGTQNTSVAGTSLGGTFTPGQSATVSFTLDDSIADADPGATFGSFPLALTSISVSSGAYSASATGGGASFADSSGVSIFQASNGAGGINDGLGIVGAGASLSGAPVGGGALAYIIVQVFGLAGDDSFVLPSVSDTFQVYLGFVDAGSGSGFAEVGFGINSVTIGSGGSGGEGVPAPGALLILGVGLLGLGLKRRVA